MANTVFRGAPSLISPPPPPRVPTRGFIYVEHISTLGGHEFAVKELAQQAEPMGEVAEDAVQLGIVESSEDSGAEAGGSGAPAAAPAASEPMPSQAAAEPGAARGAVDGPGAGAQPVAPPPPPPPPLPDVLWENMWLPEGKVTWYKKGNKFEATCKSRGHGRCVLTRTGTQSVTGPLGGRPMGLIAAWMRASPTEAPDQQTHTALGREWERQEHFDRRRSAREAWKAVGAAANLFAREAPQRPGECEEPLGKRTG